MSETLFRTQAIEHRRRLRGEVMIAQPVSHGVMTAILGVFVVVGATYLMTGTYARKETVQGYIAPTGGLAQLYATKGGIVTRVLVHEGDVVTQGQPMVELSLETTGADGQVGEKLRSETQARMQSIDTQITAAKARFDEEGRRLSARVEGLGGELASQEQRLESERRLQALQTDDAGRYAQLQIKGSGTRFELSRRQQQILAQESVIHELERQKEQRQGDLNDARSQLAGLPAERDDKLAQLQGLRSELEQSLAQLQVNRAYVMVAPVAGRVAALQAQPGQTAVAQSPLAALVPAGSNLEANLLVPPRAAGLIQPGQEVRLRVDAFPYQRFGVVSGHVVQVSRATYREGELLAPIAFKDPVYRVTVSLERTSIAAYGEERPLTPGMTLIGDVITDRRHFTDWVLDPLKAIGSR
ncbi:HlyD family efflux transporter periplasmic adaptor subunit [Agrobacterium rhizogenes]|uniref:AprE-like beta-barrel domain-containing protein n=1 Tax=Rhizobium rhizogenes NBRC 13257 TaxID=1220581 RepID=A0AA87QAK2_RHIRH|nr:HlyD family efflux transporter periplasmic adaptor subunit [Rhizobium rhizogenes]KAA6486239.1 HlyD family efflux transporter periplasmic adaptor subunit [Agrobacterium sp. ICMP 7243]OCJ18801.1 protein secretion protein [Agrobacterium sp. B131/95]NTF50701.1 HlyD family efflux transporter periplasmic adaptor subunit [Rhizobium rhizogenes]NTF57393.1 HlyD family efflux transporter periplasmic adaptor subunit [Rhizobium rhizogenes]NTF76975.1 HlyD family efflux transporter periplasmic adaptor sub